MLNLTLAVLVLAQLTPSAPAATSDARPITERVWHLGDNETPEWPEAPTVPDGQGIEVTFEGRAFAGEGVLFCEQRNVNNDWHLELNGTRFATLAKKDGLEEEYYKLPAGLVIDGTNTLRLVGDTPTDDITFGKLRYFETSLHELFNLSPLVIHINSAPDLEPLPARITIETEAGELATIFDAESLHTAVREGVVYISTGKATVWLPTGKYTVTATRGPEWNLNAMVVDVGPDAEFPGIGMVLTRVVDTTGFVAADTHIHTLTFSGHGDASAEERMVTLAGEGVELAIATDHNHNTDYRPFQAKVDVGSYFTPVVGNEVSTPIGHLNGFPLGASDPVPLHESHDIVKIVEDMRAKGALAVILNHPRWPDHETGPHGVIQLDHATGDWTGTWATPFDAMELINSQTAELEPMLLFQDWFALLNRGARVFAVGSSDSHTVGGVVGQGRTYVVSATDDPAAIDADQAARDIAAGHSSISMGIFCDLRLAGKSVMGETVAASALASGLRLRVAAPEWVRPRRVTIYADGEPVLVREWAPVEGLAFNTWVEIPGATAWPAHDAWIVAVVEGDGVGKKAWPQLNNYTLAATNPLFVDFDGDGVSTSPRGLAEALFAECAGDLERIGVAMNAVDSAVAVQLLRLARLDQLAKADSALHQLAEGAAGRHPNLEEWLESLEHDH